MMRKKIYAGRWLLPLFILMTLIGGQVGTAVVHAAPCVGSNVTGTIFRDYNADGIKGAFEVGLSGLTVTAYGANGTVVDTCTTSATGTYGLTVAPASYPVRVEISGYSTPLQPGPVGTDSESTVTFVNGDSTGVDIGLNVPTHYCQDNPNITTSCFVFADQITGPRNNDPVVIDFPYQSGTTSTSSNTNLNIPTTHTLMVKANQVGTVWGLAYRHTTDTIYAAAFTKRHSGYGPNGTGAIYAINRATSSSGLFMDLNALAPFGTGANFHNTADWTNDLTAWDAVGKTSLGELDISTDEQTLWAINQWDRRLYEISIPTASISNIITLPNPVDCPVGVATGITPPASVTNNNLIPGGVKVVDNKVYIGLTCTAESTGLRSDLRGYVYEYNTTTTLFTQVANFSLNYNRYQIHNQPECTVPIGINFACDYSWLPWVPTITMINSPFTGRHYPQPWVMSVEFDENNFMIVGIMDRFGHQSGNINNAVGTVEGRQMGEVLRLQPSGATWTLENNGTSGSSTSTGANNRQGPGNGEYYVADFYSSTMPEITSGGMALQLGTGQVVLGASDPAPVAISSGPNINVRSGGIVWFNHANGTRGRSYQLFGSDAAGTFGKASGIGDLELLCSAAPIELGNRVWYDLNGNGVQDPNEPGIAGVVMGLYNSAGILIATTTTDANGRYFFNTSNLPGGVQPNTQYTIGVFDSNFNSGNPLADNTMSPSGANPNSLPTPQIRDANGVAVSVGTGPNASSRGTTFTTGGAGANDHTFDFGFFRADWGDLPDTGSGTGVGNYQTLATDSGATHLVYPDTNGDNIPDLTGAVWLGALVDGETTGTSSATAVGDDTVDGVDDEDGVVQTGTWTNGAGGATLNVTVSGVGVGTAWLVGWLDFNNDGVFDSFVSQSVVVGSNSVALNVPPGTFGSSAITVYGRFRLFANQADALAVAGGPISNTAGFTGSAVNGEVEDYTWNFTPTAVTLQTTNIQSNGNNTIPYLIITIFMGMVLTTWWFRRSIKSVH